MEENNVFIMDELIARIVAEVRDQTRWVPGKRGNLARFLEAVWNRLVDAALQGDEGPFFLIGYEKTKNVVSYRSTSGWVKMSPERLRGRLRSNFKEVLEAIK